MGVLISPHPNHSMLSIFVITAVPVAGGVGGGVSPCSLTVVSLLMATDVDRASFHVLWLFGVASLEEHVFCPFKDLFIYVIYFVCACAGSVCMVRRQLYGACFLLPHVCGFWDQTEVARLAWKVP